MIDLSQVLALVGERKWMLLLALVIGFVVRQVKPDAAFPVNVPARLRPLVAVLLGVIAGACDALLAGTPWKDALVTGVSAALLAILGHVFGIDVLRGGKEVPPLGRADQNKAKAVTKIPPLAVLALSGLIAIFAACKGTSTTKVIDVTQNVVEKGCELLEAVTDDGTVKTICAKADEISAIIDFVQPFLKKADGGVFASTGPCRVIKSTSSGAEVCAPMPVLAAAIDRTVAKRQSLLIRDAGAQ